MPMLAVVTSALEVLKNLPSTRSLVLFSAICTSSRSCSLVADRKEGSLELTQSLLVAVDVGEEQTVCFGTIRQ